MATPAANDFLKDILAERKKLLPSQGVFSFAQILTREQFYRNNIFPAEINNLVEKEVWNLVWKKVGQPTENSLVFFSDLLSLENAIFFIRFHKEVKIGENYTDGLNFDYKSYPEMRESLELEEEQIENKLKKDIFQIKPTKFEFIWVNGDRVKSSSNFKVNHSSLRWVSFRKERATLVHFYREVDYDGNPFKLTNLTKQEQKQAEKTKEIFWLLRILRKDITLAEIAPTGLREQQEFIQNHFKREFTELHQNNPQIFRASGGFTLIQFSPSGRRYPRNENYCRSLPIRLKFGGSKRTRSRK